MNQELCQLELVGKTPQVLDELQGDCSLQTREQVFDLALNLTHWMIKQLQAGYDFGRVNESGKFEGLVFPCKGAILKNASPV